MGTILQYIVYKTTNTINNKIYIGVHATKTLEFDGYIGNGIYKNKLSRLKNPKTPFQKAVLKYGINSFSRCTLKTFDNLQDALDLERWLVDENFIKRDDTYNVVLGGSQFLPTNAKKIFLYNKEGKFVDEFDSHQQLSIFLYGEIKNLGNITRAIKYKYFINGYQLRETKIDNVQDVAQYKLTLSQRRIKTFSNRTGSESSFGKNKNILQFDKDFNFIEKFNSINECKKAGFTNVYSVLKGDRKTCKGFYFKYAQD